MNRAALLLLAIAAAAAPARAQLQFNVWKPLDGGSGTVRRVEKPAEPASGGGAEALLPAEPDAGGASPTSAVPVVSPGAARAGYQPGQKDRYHARSRDEIREALKQIEKRAPAAARGKPRAERTPAEQVEALNRLNAYRYLCGLSYDVALDEEHASFAQAAAEICEKLGRLDHNPPNPGMPEADYRRAATGAGRCNLFAGGGPASSINGYMNDSDPGNIDRVGHRRWCLNPRMGRTGFGHSGSYAAMYAMDGSGSTRSVDVVAYPPPGYMASRYFSPGYAWSVSLNPGVWHVPDENKVAVSVCPASHFGAADPKKRDAPLKLNYLHVDQGGYGMALCVIFRPEEVDCSPGHRYWVEVKGLAGPRSSLEYLVDFIE